MSPNNNLSEEEKAMLEELANNVEDRETNDLLESLEDEQPDWGFGEGWSYNQGDSD